MQEIEPKHWLHFKTNHDSFSLFSFFCCDQIVTRNQIVKEGLILAPDLRGDGPGWWGRHGGRSVWQPFLLLSQSGSRKWTNGQEVGLGTKPQSPPLWPAPPRGSTSWHSTPFGNSATHWKPSVQTWEPAEDIAYSDHGKDTTHVSACLDVNEVTNNAFATLGDGSTGRWCRNTTKSAGVGNDNHADLTYQHWNIRGNL